MAQQQTYMPVLPKLHSSLCHVHNSCTQTCVHRVHAYSSCIHARASKASSFLVPCTQLMYATILRQEAQVQATSYTNSPNTSNQLVYTQHKHRQPVTQTAKAQANVLKSAQAQATSYTSNASTCNQLYKKRKHTRPVIQATQAQATSYASSRSTGNQFCKHPKHR